MRKILPLVALPLLAACAGAVPKPATTTRPVPPRAVAIPATNPAPPVAGFRAPTVMRQAGLEQIIGRDAAGLTRQLGTPRLDVLEGDARKLQFSGQACVLDVYLYPLAPGAQPTATHVEARRVSDGVDVDRASCAKALAR